MDTRLCCARLHDSVKLQFIGIVEGFRKCWVVRLSNLVCVCVYLLTYLFFQLTKAEQVFHVVLRNIYFFATRQLAIDEMKTRVHEQGVICFGVFVSLGLNNQKVQYIIHFTS